MERQSTIQQGVLKKKERRTQWQLFVVNWKSSRKATDLGRRWQRYTAILVRQRQAVGTERCGRSGLGKLLRKAGVRGTAYCKRGRRAGTAYCKEGRGRARLSPRRQTLAAKAEKTIDSIVRAQCEPK
ncbi:BZ3501_MvSof-1269-A2-R1_Chr12-3g03561 [Microbotryum saponariae]|nr:BZ3501_MvSof-1269-A2-R1_Chr12-3g03561 [Microbotryum saponariae]